MDNDLERLVGASKPDNENKLTEQARAFRALLPLIQDVGHLRDLVQMFLNHTRVMGVIGDSTRDYFYLCHRLAKPDLGDDELALGLGLLAPALANRGAKILLREEQVKRKARAQQNAEQDALMKVIHERQEQITKIDQGSGKHSIHQLWVCAYKPLLEDEKEYQYSRFHPSGYGTRCGEITMCVEGEHAGKFTCTFYRGTSSD
jgi:hypothetical protein